MFSFKVSRRMFAPVGGAAATAMFVVTAAPKAPPPPPPPPKDCDPSKVLVRPRELPIYGTEPPCVKEIPPPPPEEPNIVRDVISTTRKELLNSWNQLEGVKSQFWQTLSVGKAHTEATLETLRAEENATMRYGAIGGSGLFGLILSLRKGVFKKLFYINVCSLTMAAICYPEEANEYSAEAFRLGKRYYNIGYHFFTGVVKDMGINVPEFGNPVEVVQGWIGMREPIKGPGSAALLPPTTETPSHVVPLSQSKAAASHRQAGAIPMPPIDSPGEKQMKA